MRKGAPRLSIKLRITLWYAALMVEICAFALFILVSVAERAADRYCRETLLSATAVIIDELDIDKGRLEVDSDIDEVPGVYAALFDLEGELIYGRRRVSEPFAHGQFLELYEDGHSWYIHDTRLQVEGMEDVWLRVHMSANVNENSFRSVVSGGAWLLPLSVLLALLGGYLITARAFRPVGEMSALAASIAGGGDLSRRVSMGESGADELHALADTLNAMLGRLEDAFRRESRFASDAAHELRTPLGAMRMQGEYALSRTDVQEKDEAVGRMLEKAEDMQALVDHLLMIARMDAGEIDMSDTCDLAAMLARVAEDMDMVAMERSVRIETALAPCVTRGSRSMLSRIAVNLLDNAIRYGREGGLVRLTLDNDGRNAVIRVEDDGPGMSEAECAHAFERFWRSDASRSSSGTGIGLAIVQAAAHAHGGEAGVQSEAGKGCTFTVKIPLRT